MFEEDEEWVTLVSAADEVAVHACVREVMDEVDSVLEGTIEAITEGETVIEIERADLQWADGQQVTLTYGGEGEELLVTVGHIPVGEDRIIDLRLVSSASIPPRDELWRTLVESAAATPPPEIDAFPVVESTDEAPNERALDPATEAVLAASEVIGTTEVWNPGYALRGQEVLVHEGRRIVAIADHSEEPSLYLLLGMVYERCGRDNASELARASYEKCLDLRRWGPVAEDAEKALERLAAT